MSLRARSRAPSSRRRRVRRASNSAKTATVRSTSSWQAHGSPISCRTCDRRSRSGASSPKLSTMARSEPEPVDHAADEAGVFANEADAEVRGRDADRAGAGLGIAEEAGHIGTVGALGDPDAAILV